MKNIWIRTVSFGMAAGILSYSGCINNSQKISNDIFSVKESKVLSVSTDKGIFIEKDDINYFDSFDVAEKLIKNTNDEISAINVIHENDKNIQFRKEVAFHHEGYLELTIKIKVFPSIDNTAPRKVVYSFRIPVKVFDEMKFRALCGRSSICKPLEGNFNSLNDSIKECRYIVFKGEKGSYTFDFNPAGPYSHMDYPSYGEPVGYWNIIKNGNYVDFELASTVKYYGTALAGKVLIYKEAYEFAQKHSQTKWSYSANNSTTGFLKQFSFGTDADIDMFEKADRLEYSPEKKYGWAETDSLQIVKSDRPAITENCVSSPGGTSGKFIMDIPPGVYILTLRCGHNKLKTGPFDISINGKVISENIEIPTGETESIDFVYYLKKPDTQININFNGKNTWAVRSIIAQAVIFQEEDFSITRKQWIVDKLFSPDIEYTCNKENN